MSSTHRALNDNEEGNHAPAASSHRKKGRHEHSTAIDSTNNDEEVMNTHENNQHKGIGGRIMGVVEATAGKLHQGYNAVKSVVAGTAHAVSGAAHAVTEKAHVVTEKAKSLVGMGHGKEEDETSTSSSENEGRDQAQKLRRAKHAGRQHGIKPRKAKYHKNDNDHNNHIRLPGQENEDEVNNTRHRRRGGEPVSITDHNMFEPLNHTKENNEEIAVGGRK
jgi:hypothetical protein